MKPLFKRLAFIAAGVAVASALVFTSAVPQAEAQSRCPVSVQSPNLVILSEGFIPDPRYYPITAGGNVNLDNCYQPGFGWVDRRPDITIRYRAHNGVASQNPLIFSTQSNADTILLIRAPNGSWHFDDDGGHGLNARIRFSFAQDGDYDIWIGTLTPGHFPAARLVVSELDD